MAKLFSDEAADCEVCKSEEFTINEHGAITDPGKFEAEGIETYHAYHVMLDGFADEDETFSDESSCCRVGNMLLSESDQGFVYGEVFISDEAASARLAEMVTEDEDEPFSPVNAMYESQNA